MIAIGLDNRHDTNNEYKFEYPKTLLEESESKYISIPLSVITDTELDAKRVGAYSYLRIRCGLDNIIGFIVPDMVEWCGGKSDKRTNGTNDKFLNIIDALNDRGYLTYLTKQSRSSYMQCKFDTAYSRQECSDGFAVVYLDEIDKIMSYKKENAKDSALTNTTILLTFAYLRNKIWRRPNELKPEERSEEGIRKRKERCPEVYDSTIDIIADDIGISSKTLSKIIDILEYELELIVTDRAYRIKNENGEFRTPPTLFANAYKREDKYLLATGEEYSRTEIELKAANMKQYYQDYKIDKRKRKQKIKGETDCE